MLSIKKFFSLLRFREIYPKEDCFSHQKRKTGGAASIGFATTVKNILDKEAKAKKEV